MEESSHELIDKMIAEEQYCYGFDSVPNISNSVSDIPAMPFGSQIQPTSAKSFGITSTGNDSNINPFTSSSINETTLTKHDVTDKKDIDTPATPSSLPPHSQKWSETGNTLLLEGTNSFGYAHWKAVSEYVKTRNALLSENRAGQKYSTPSSQQNEPLERNDTTLMPSSLNTSYESFISYSQQEEVKSIKLENMEHVAHLAVPSIKSTETSASQVVSNLSQGTHNSLENASSNLDKEYVIDQDEVSEDERKKNVEWFMGKSAKTPERYMRIRNHIIECWKKSRPQYLTKTAGRRSLTDCGDVNAVGRIHAYLESVHAINVNCTSPVKRQYGRSNKSNESGLPEKKKSRKRPGYYWQDVDSEDEEELSTQHVFPSDEGKLRPKRAVKKPETFYNEHDDEFGHAHNPFTLVPVGYYPNKNSSPFTVNISSNSLLVMDFHSHLASTEVIGLLGGRVIQQEDGSQDLKVEYVFPCRSASTGFQCEMDPVSEMDARELFERNGLRVVGWYHSHPTFEPEPSIRDIENQSSYQELFRDSITGVEPFIGVIITPFNSRNVASERSQFQFIHISKNWDTSNRYRLPFACSQKITKSDMVTDEVYGIMCNLITEYTTYEHKINMDSKYGAVTRLDKLILSLANHLFMDAREKEVFLFDIRSKIEDEYIGKERNTANSTLAGKPSMSNIVKSLAI